MYIGEGAFHGCSSLHSLEVSDCLNTIVNDAFVECGSIVFEVHRDDMYDLQIWISHGAFTGLDSVEFVSADENRILTLCNKNGAPIEDLTTYSGDAYYVWDVPTKQHLVTLVWDDGTTETSTYAEGVIVVLPILPDRPGHVLSWTSDDVIISEGSFVMPDTDVTIKVQAIEIEEPPKPVDKGKQDAPAPGKGYTIDYIDESIVAEPGYQVSRTGESWNSSIPIQPGITIYVRLAETDYLHASPSTENVIEERPTTPEPELIISGDSVSVTDPRMEIWIRDFGWSSTISGLTIGQEYHLTIRLAATSTSFYGTFQFATIIAGTPPDTGKDEQDAPAPGKGYTIDYIDESVTAWDGYEVSNRENGPWSQTVNVEPGRYFYVRLAETDNLYASQPTLTDVPNRGPGPYLNGHYQTIEDTTSAMEYRATGQSGWTTCPNGELTLAPGTYELRYKAVPGESFASKVTEYEILPAGQPGDVVTVDEIKFEVLMDGTVAIIGFSGTPTSIPSTVTIGDVSHRISEIQGGAFNGCSSLRSVSLPDGLITINQSAFVGCSSLESLDIPDSVKSIGDWIFEGCVSLREVSLSDSLEIIGNHVFINCKSLESLDIPDSVKKIGVNLFSGCVSLRQVNIPDHITIEGTSNMFNGCASLKSFTMPSGFKDVGNQMFSGCESLENVVISPNVTYIGYSAFYGCESLTSVNLPEGLEHIDQEAFQGCTSLKSINLPYGVTEIPDYVFYGCESMEKVDISEGIAFIGKYAFGGCTSLESISIPDSVTSIGEFAFYGCTSLRTLDIPHSVNEIRGRAFENCTSLTSVDFSDGVASIGYYAFAGCESLKSMNIPNSVTSIGLGAFYGCTSLESISIPDSVTTIGGYAFYECSSLTDIVLPNGLTVIDSATLAFCTSLESVILPDSLVYLRDEAFYRCSSLHSVTIPASVESIGEYAFSGCGSLSAVMFKSSEDRVSFGTNSFSTHSTLSVYAIGWDPATEIRNAVRETDTTILDTRENGAVQSSDIEYTGSPIDLSETVSILFPGGDISDENMSYAITSTDTQSSPSNGWTKFPSATHAGQYRLWYMFETDGRVFSGCVDVTIDKTPLKGSLTISMDGPAVPGTLVTAEFSMSNWSKVSYQWYRGTQPILGADDASYTLTDKDVGKSVYVVAVPADTSDYSGYIYSYVGQQGSQSAEGTPGDETWPPSSDDNFVIDESPDAESEQSKHPSSRDDTIWIAIGIAVAICVIGALVFLRLRS